MQVRRVTGLTPLGLLALVVALIYMRSTERDFTAPIESTIKSSVETIMGPSPQVMAAESSDGFHGLDYVAQVHCTVYNSGGGGSVTVTGVLQGGAYWRKSDERRMAEDATARVTLTFPEATLLSSGLEGYEFGCEAR